MKKPVMHMNEATSTVHSKITWMNGGQETIGLPPTTSGQLRIVQIVIAMAATPPPMPPSSVQKRVPDFGERGRRRRSSSSSPAGKKASKRRPAAVARSLPASRRSSSANDPTTPRKAAGGGSSGVLRAGMGAFPSGRERHFRPRRLAAGRQQTGGHQGGAMPPRFQNVLAHLGDGDAGRDFHEAQEL